MGYPWIATAAVTKVATQLNRATDGGIDQHATLTEFLDSCNQMLHGKSTAGCSPGLGQEATMCDVYNQLAELSACVLDSWDAPILNAHCTLFHLSAA